MKLSPRLSCPLDLPTFEKTVSPDSFKFVWEHCKSVRGFGVCCPFPGFGTLVCCLLGAEPLSRLVFLVCLSGALSRFARLATLLSLWVEPTCLGMDVLTCVLGCFCSGCTQL